MTTCPESRNWTPLLAHRFDPQAGEPEGWAEALAHLERCDPCRSEALEVDPTLLFHRLAVPPQIDGPAESEAMRRAVAAMRRAERVEQRTRPVSQAFRGRFAAAAAVALVVLALGSSTWLDRGGAKSSEIALGGRTPAAADVFDPVAEQAVPPMPVYEWLDNPDSRIYQIAEDPEFTMVMIVSDKYENLGV